MFQKQFSLIAQEEESLKELCVFARQVYIKVWFTAPEAIDTPHRDLALLISLLQLFNKALFFATSHKMTKHQWYLSEELDAHSFFNDAVSFETKQHMVSKLQNKDDEQDSLKRPQHPLGFLKDKHLQDFVTTKTKKFF